MKTTRQSIDLTTMIKPFFKINGRVATAVMVAIASLVTISTTAHAELIIQNSPINISNSQPQPAINTNQQTQPSDASLDKLIAVLHIDSMIDDMLAQRKQAADTIKGLPSEFPTDKKAGIISRQAQKQLKNIFIKYGTILGQQLDQPISKQSLQQAYKNIAKKTYTQAEVDALNQFYDNPLGQSILPKQSQVSMEFVQVMMPTMLGDSSDLEKTLPNLQKEIEKIFE